MVTFPFRRETEGEMIVSQTGGPEVGAWCTRDGVSEPHWGQGCVCVCDNESVTSVFPPPLPVESHRKVVDNTRTSVINAPEAP